jgi:hypothetical protein
MCSASAKLGALAIAALCLGWMGCGPRDLDLHLALPDGGCPVAAGGVLGIQYEVSLPPDDGGVRRPLCGVTVPTAVALTSGDQILAALAQGAPPCSGVPRSTDVSIQLVGLDSGDLTMASKRQFCASGTVHTPDGTSSATSAVQLMCDASCAQSCVIPVCAFGQDCFTPLMACGGPALCVCARGQCIRRGSRGECP